MAGRLLTVNERCFTTVQMRLAEITIENGYSCTVNRVYRKDGNHIAAMNPPEIYLYRLGVSNAPRTSESNTDRIDEVARFEIRFFPKPSDQIDRDYALMLGDIQRCLPHEMHGALVDPFYSRGHIWLRPLQSQAYYSPKEVGFIMGRAIWQMTYYYCASSPFHWDQEVDQHGVLTGSNVVTEDQLPLPG